MALHRLTRSIRQLLDHSARRRREAAARRHTYARLELVTLEERAVPANASGTVMGSAFIDSNANGLRDASERAFAGASFTLTGTTTTGKSVQGTVLTDAGGNYRFANVLPGSYQVTANPTGGLVPFSANGAALGRAAVSKVVLSRFLAGGQTANVQVGYGRSVSAVSLNQFRNTVTPVNTTPGGGLTNINVRANNSPFLLRRLSPVFATTTSANREIDLAGFFSDPDINNNTRAQIVTSLGNINLVLFEKSAPRTVQNFINYITSNRYDNTIFHRHATNFVLQGGGYRFAPATATNPKRLVDVPTDVGVQNEPGIRNTVGTIAMAKLPGDPNSATNEFFINLNNNTDLNTQNGGFTVFGKLAGAADQSVVDNLTSLPVRSLNSPFDSLPSAGLPSTVTSFPPNANRSAFVLPSNVDASDFALIRDAKVVSRNEELKYTVVRNSNAGIVRARIVNNRLVLDFVNNARINGQAHSVITLSATDRFGATVQTNLVVKVNNLRVALTPAAPNTNSMLTATATPADGSRLTYVWKRGDTVVKTTANTLARTDTLDLSLTGNGNKNDQITVEVRQASLAGAVATASRTVVDSAPTVNTVTVTPANPNAVSTLTATVNSSDPDSDSVTNRFVWKKNNVVIPNQTSSTLSLSVVGASPGNTFFVEVTPVAGGLTGTMKASNVVTVS